MNAYCIKHRGRKNDLTQTVHNDLTKKTKPSRCLKCVCIQAFVRFSKQSHYITSRIWLPCQLPCSHKKSNPDDKKKEITLQKQLFQNSLSSTKIST